MARPKSNTVLDRYIVRSGDTLGKIALQFDLPIDLVKMNGLTNPNALPIGQVLKIPQRIAREVPGDYLLPDSEVVYSPAYFSFDVQVFVNQAGGYLSSCREKVEGDSLTGPQIIQLVAERYSVRPRVLLALLERQGGWVTRATLSQNRRSSPLGIVGASSPSLFTHASRAADLVNEGCYGQVIGSLAAFRFRDRTRALVSPAADPGTAPKLVRRSMAAARKRTPLSRPMRHKIPRTNCLSVIKPTPRRAMLVPERVPDERKKRNECHDRCGRDRDDQSAL